MLTSLVLASAAFALEGNGRATVVWLQPDLPAEELREKAEKLVGSSAAHASWSDIAFTVSPFGKEDEARLGALDRASADAGARWNGFDVETEIAAGMGKAVDAVDVLRNDADRTALTKALLLQGAAATRIVPASRYATSDEVEPYRVFVGSNATVRPFVNAFALEPDGVWTRTEVPDAIALEILGELRTSLEGDTRAHLDFAAAPAGVTFVVDGRPVDTAGAGADLPAGRHYVHVLVGGKIAGRKVVDVSAGGAATFEPAVSREELDAAAARVREESKEIPEDVAYAVNVIARRGGAPTPTFLAALDDKGKVVLVPYSGGAAFQKRSPVTVLLGGSVGGAMILSPAFTDSVGESHFGFGAGGNLGAEVGIYNLAIYGGTALILTPTESMRFANADNTENVDTNAFFHPYGGVGVYLPRPDAKKPLLLLGVDYGWLSPGAIGVGGRVSFGIPTGDGTWFRIELDGFRGTQMTGFPAEGEATVGAGLRLGFGRKL